MKKISRILSFLLVFITIVATFSSFTFEVHAAESLTEEQFVAAINAAKAEYPHGYYWNEYNGKDANGIAKAGTIKCKGTSNSNEKSCSTNGYCGYNGTSCTCLCGYYHGWQCFGFGNLLAYKTLGSWATNGYSSSQVNSSDGWKYYSSVSEYYAGDFVRINDSHTIFIYKVEGSSVYYAECNYTGPCKINWEGKTTVSQLKSKTTFVVHKTGNTLKGTGTSSGTSSDYIATDFNPTIKDGIYSLKIAYTSGKMLNVDDSTTKFWLTTCDANASNTQKFYFKHQANGKYHIYAISSGANGSVYNKVVDVNIGESNSDVLNLGDKFDLWTQESKWDYCQLFYIVHVGDGKYVIELASMPNAVLAAKNSENAETDGGAITLRNYEGYTTQQWYFYNENGTAPVDPSIDGSLTYTVNYSASGANNIPASQSKVHGTSLTISSAAPTKSGYIFKGWDTSSSASTVVYQPGATYSANANVTLYAVWEANKYTVNYNVNGGTNAPSAQTKVHGTNLTLSSTIPTKSGYVFKGWDTSSGASTVVYQPGATYSANANVTLYAVWETNKYTVSYNANGGTNAPSAQTKVHGTNLTLSSTIPTKSGYIFKGWDTSSSATNVVYAAGATYTSNANVTLYAVWEANKYTVNYNVNGGTNAPSAQTKVHDVTLTLSSTIPTKNGYSFAGWRTSDGTTYQAGAAYTANAGTTLYAVWTANEYTVSYDANGGSNTPAPQTKIYETALTITNTVPVKTGYTFMGWATSSNATVALYQSGDSYTNNADVTLYAVWKENVVVDDSNDDVNNETTADKETVDNQETTVDKETTVNKETVDKETAVNKETVVDTNDNSNVNNDIENNNDDKDNETEQKKSGCNSNIALSGLLMISVLGLVFVRKSQKKTNSNRKS